MNVTCVYVCVFKYIVHVYIELYTCQNGKLIHALNTEWLRSPCVIMLDGKIKHHLASRCKMLAK